MPSLYQTKAPYLIQDLRSGQSLAELAQRNLASPQQESDYAELLEKIEGFLASRRDHVFGAALSMLDDDNLRAELEHLIEEASQSSELFVGWNGTKPQPCEAMLFGIPVLIGLLPGETAPSEFSGMDQLIESLRRHKLASNEHGIYLSNKCFRLSDLDLPPSHRRLLLQNLVTRYFGGSFCAAHIRPAIRAAEWIDLEESFPSLALGFFVGVALSSMQDAERPFYPDDVTAFEQYGQAWSDEVSAWLEQRLGYSFVRTSLPEIFTDAVKSGIDEYRATAVEINAKLACLSMQGEGGVCCARLERLSADKSRKGIQITVQARKPTKYFWPVMSFDDSDQVVPDIQEILAMEGITKTSFVQGRTLK